MLLEKAIAFYTMDEQQLRDYTRIPHKIDNSAANHMINEYTEGGDVLGGKPPYLVYECEYCKNIDS